MTGGLYGPYGRLAPYGYDVPAPNIDVQAGEHAPGLVHPPTEHTNPGHGATSLEQYSLAHHSEQLHAYEDPIVATHLADHHGHGVAHGADSPGDTHEPLPPAKSLAPPVLKPGVKGKPPEEEEAITSLQKLRYSSRDQKDLSGGPLDGALHDGSGVGDLGVGPRLVEMNPSVSHLTADSASLMEGSLRDEETSGVMWKCPKCGKACKTKSSMNTHMNRKHADSKDNQCPHCRRSYAIKDSLTKHIARKHSTLAKTFVCNQYGCNKSFPTLKERQDHFARHSKVKSYTCDFPNCQCTYTTKNSLNLHVARNHKDPRFTCAHCGEKYAVRGDLNQHERRKHGITPSGEDKLSDGEGGLLNDGVVPMSSGAGPVIDGQQLEHITSMTSDQLHAQQQYHSGGGAYAQHGDMGMDYNVDNHLMLQGGEADDKQKGGDESYDGAQG